MSAGLSRRALLANGTGLAATAATVGATQTAIEVSARQTVSVLDWGVRGNNDPTDGERLQRALDEAPLGSNLVFPPGDFRTCQPLRLRQHLNLIGAGDTRLTGDFDSKSEAALLDVNVEDPGNRDNRNQRIQGMRLWIVSGVGDALAFRNRAPNIANIGLIIENNLISGSSVGPGYAIRLEGIGTQHLTVRNNQIINGVYVASADGVTIEECLMWGEKPGVTLDLIPGAFQTRILRNAIVTRGGALRVLNGSQIYFEHNQVEQPPQLNQSPEGAHVAIVPRSYGSRHIRIRSNNFGAGDNVRLAVYVNGDCQDLLIEDNVFNPPSTGTDILLAGPEVGWTRIGSNNNVRQSGVTKRKPANAGMLHVDDRGTGSFGVQFFGAVLAATSGWHPDAAFRFWKDLDGMVRFEGHWTAGTTIAGTRIGTMPTGFRPRSAVRVLLVTDAGDLASVEVRPDGAMTVLRAAAGRVGWSNACFAAALRPDYPASDP